MAKLKDVIRAATIGAKKQFKSELVTLVAKRVPVIDERGALVKELKPVLNDDGKPTFDETGAAVTAEVIVLRDVHVIGDDGKPVVVEVRQPSVKQRAHILRAAKVNLGNSQDQQQLHVDALQVEAVISCSFVPGTDERVFDAADRESLLGQPPGGFLDQLAGVAVGLLNVDSEAVAKNSEGTPSGSNSSS